MNILIDVGHPAHVHLFRNAARIWIDRGHRVIYAARDRKLVPELIKAYGFDYRIVSKARKSQVGLLYELIEHDWNLLKLAVDFKADIMIGTSISITHAAKIHPSRSIVFNEDDIDYLKSFAVLAYPFADAIVVPECLHDKRTPRYITYDSYQELAYLHPNHFVPDPAVLHELGIGQNERYFVIRLVALKSHHDTGKKGISDRTRRRLINLLSKYGKVFITAEGLIPEELKQYQLPTPPERIHHVLNYAAMLVSDSQTMTIEAAVLGTPAIRCNTFVGLCSVIEELEHRYELTYGFSPEQEGRMLSKIEELLALPNLKAEWASRRKKMLNEKIDLTAWMVNFIENYFLIQTLK